MAKINARKKGHSYELLIRDFFKELGYTDCVSSRSESKNLDDKGVDLVFTGSFWVQCKAVENLGSVHAILDRMPKDDKMNLVFHKKNRQGTIVCMELETFRTLAKKFSTDVDNSLK
jgi:D-arabinose 1-dehydrogenase-like Zn-dependent alcohol dehydrogenase